MAIPCLTEPPRTEYATDTVLDASLMKELAKRNEPLEACIGPDGAVIEAVGEKGRERLFTSENTGTRSDARIVPLFQFTNPGTGAHEEPVPSSIGITTPTTSIFQARMSDYGQLPPEAGYDWSTPWMEDYVSMGEIETHPLFRRMQLDPHWLLGHPDPALDGEMRVDTFLLHYSDSQIAPVSELEAQASQIRGYPDVCRVQFGQTTDEHPKFMVRVASRNHSRDKTQWMYDLLHKGKAEKIELVTWKGTPSEMDYDEEDLVELIRFGLPGEQPNLNCRRLFQELLEQFREHMLPFGGRSNGRFDGRFNPAIAGRPLAVDHYSTSAEYYQGYLRRRRDVAMLIVWKGTRTRAKWLDAFMTYNYEEMGHKAHILGTICPTIESWSVVFEHDYVN
ncbi:hypothetical protein PG995_007017 [Apiospora arundinis]